MPAKSRRNRRNISQSRKIVTGPNTAKAVPETMEPAPQPEKSIVSYRSTSKTAVAPAPTYPYILSEIKWIALVTGIVVILLIIAYLFFR